jgi:hypothetical protein
MTEAGYTCQAETMWVLLRMEAKKKGAETRLNEKCKRNDRVYENRWKDVNKKTGLGPAHSLKPYWKLTPTAIKVMAVQPRSI